MYYPMMVSIKDELAVIIGGGRIGLRKARTLLTYGAKLRIVSPDMDEAFKSLDGEVEYIFDEYNRKYIGDAFLVIGATSSRHTNSRIGEDCREMKTLCNIVDAREESKFISPAIVDKEGLLIAISSKGSFPALSKYIKKDLDTRYGRFDHEYLGLLEKLRTLVMEKYYGERIEIFYRALDLDLQGLKDLYRDLDLG